LIYRYFIKLSYKGTHYHGWQIQPNAVTVQEILNRDLGIILGEEISVTGCGRTDTGVHAGVFWAHFDSGKEGLHHDKDLLYSINGKLPEDIAVHEIHAVFPDAHARYSATSRTYQYYIHRKKEVFGREYAHTIYGEMDTFAMQRASDLLLEYTDFTSFSKVDTDVKTNDCRITEARWESEGDSLVFTISADRFLRNMVRAIVGTLLDVGFGKTSTEEFRKIIESKNRSMAGASAPAKGLFLTAVDYPMEIFS
jgi:tRNA pseudouridine38-40 synthase